MALLLDGLVCSLEDLLQVDSGVSEVGRAEGINIDHKLALAQRDCELKISQFVVNHGLESRLGSLNNVPRLDRIVVGEGLRRWFALQALQLFYSDAYYRVLNDRYSKKLEHFATMATAAWDAYTDTGIACVYNPIPRGEIAQIELNQMPIGVGTYNVAIAWVDSSGNSGSLSEVEQIQVAEGQGFTIVPSISPAGVAGYDIYAGAVGKAIRKQTDSIVPEGQLYSAGTILSDSSRATAPVQNIDFVLRKSRIFTRG
jgi:hypothetical protein